MIYDYKNKATNISDHVEMMFAKSATMFEWDGLPDTIPAVEVELRLQRDGYVFIAEHAGKMYALSGGLGGELDEYGHPTQIVVANPALKLHKVFDLADGVLIKNDDRKIGLMPLYTKTASMLVENEINMSLYGINSRIQTLFSASDDKTKQSAELFLKKLVDGELGVIGESQLLDTLKTHSTASSNSIRFTDLIEYHQYVKATMLNEIGLNANFNLKRERLIKEEVEQTEDSLFPFVYNMLGCREFACEEINAKFGLELKVQFGSVWALKNMELVKEVIDDEVPNSEEWENSQQQSTLKGETDENSEESEPGSGDSGISDIGSEDDGSDGTGSGETGDAQPVVIECDEINITSESVHVDAGEPEEPEISDDRRDQ